MSKQEEIREGVGKRLDLYIDEGSVEERLIKRADKILSYLHSQGVVIKVERELPESWVVTYGGEAPTPDRAYVAGQEDGKADMLEAGCGFFEPLVEVKDG